MKINIVIEDKLGTILSCKSVCAANLKVSRPLDCEEELIVIIEGDEFIINQWRSDALPNTPIELPSDEEIEKSNPFVWGSHIFGTRDLLVWEQGAKWLKNKIQGGNNEQQ